MYRNYYSIKQKVETIICSVIVCDHTKTHKYSKAKPLPRNMVTPQIILVFKLSDSIESHTGIYISIYRKAIRVFRLLLCDQFGENLAADASIRGLLSENLNFEWHRRNFQFCTPEALWLLFVAFVTILLKSSSFFVL